MSSGHQTAETTGVDITLIREMLALSPEERLQWLERMIRTIQEVAGAAEERTDHPSETAD